MTKSTNWQIADLSFIGESDGAERDVLMITLSPDWQLEDADEIAGQLSTIFKARLVEQIDGADRTSFRLLIDEQPLVLQFEFYSHACWLEAELDDGSAILRSLLKSSLGSG